MPYINEDGDMVSRRLKARVDYGKEDNEEMANEYRIEQLEKKVESNRKNLRLFAEELTELKLKFDEAIEKEWERVEVVRQSKQGDEKDEEETKPKRVIFEYE